MLHGALDLRVPRQGARDTATRATSRAPAALRLRGDDVESAGGGHQLAASEMQEVWPGVTVVAARSRHRFSVFKAGRDVGATKEGSIVERTDAEGSSRRRLGHWLTIPLTWRITATLVDLAVADSSKRRNNREHLRGMARARIIITVSRSLAVEGLKPQEEQMGSSAISRRRRIGEGIGRGKV